MIKLPKTTDKSPGVIDRQEDKNWQNERKRTKGKFPTYRFAMRFSEVTPISSPELLNRIYDAWDKVATAPMSGVPKYATYDAIVLETGLSPAIVFGVLKQQHLSSPGSIAFNTDRNRFNSSFNFRTKLYASDEQYFLAKRAYCAECGKLKGSKKKNRYYPTRPCLGCGSYRTVLKDTDGNVIRWDKRGKHDTES